jgi:esterase
MKGLRVHLPDLRNHGKSPRSPDFSIPSLAGDLADYLEAEELGPCLVGGHSLGAKVAMELALSRPQLVRALVCFDMAPRAYEPRYTGYLDSLRRLEVTRIGSRAEARAALEPDIDASTLAFLLKSLVPDTAHPGGWKWLLNLEAISAAYPHIWQEVAGGRCFEGPALFVTGGTSDYVGARDVDDVIDRFPQAELTAVPEAGHWLHAEKPAEVLNELRNWIVAQKIAEVPEWS